LDERLGFRAKRRRRPGAWAGPIGSPHDGKNVVRLAGAGVSDDVILAQIRSKGQFFDLTTDQLLKLKAASVSDRVIGAMMRAPSQALHAPHALAPPRAASHQPPAAIASPSPAKASVATAAAPVPVQASAPITNPSPAAAKASTAPAAAPARTSAPWVTHDDPMGFAVSLPAGWNLSADHSQGRIAIQGPQGQQAIVWPMFIEKRQLDASGAGVLVQQLARRADPGAVWGEPQAASAGVRVLARGQRSGVAVMRWRSAPEGATIYLFCATAPSSLYRASVDEFAGILKSFHVLPGQTTGSHEAPATAAAVSQVAWVRWTDPREGAFAASVPQGWSVSGGSFRQSATDIRKSVVLLSPDRQIRIIAGDANLGAFLVPNAMFARVGMRPGSSTSIGDGTKLELRNYQPARQFLGEYVTRTVGRECSAPRVLSGDERPDLAAAATAGARGQGARQSRVTTAGVSFACTWSGREARGYYAAATVLVSSGPSSLWYVDSLYGYLAVADRQQEADSISRHVAGSMQVNSQWQQQENGIASNARSQEIQARARAEIAADQQKTSDMMMKSYQTQSQAYDEIARRRENAILGTVDVVDPSSGKQYKIDNYSDYHWMNNQGVIAGTKTDTSPGYDWRQMINLP
jgi:hypothetical protein